MYRGNGRHRHLYLRPSTSSLSLPTLSLLFIDLNILHVNLLSDRFFERCDELANANVKQKQQIFLQTITLPVIYK